MFDRIMALATVGLLAMAVSAGCNHSPENRLVGRWQGKVLVDRSAVEGQIDKKIKNKMAAVLAKGVIDKMLQKFESASITLNFRKNGTYDGSVKGLPGKDRNISGTWKVVSSAGSEIKIEIEQNGKKETTTIAFRGRDEFTIKAPPGVQEIPDGIEFRFRRME